MRSLPVILVIVNLLLRGVAVPHVHASPADEADRTARPHVHLSGHACRHAPTHAHHQAGLRHGHGLRHVHEEVSTEHVARVGDHDTTSLPEHDDDAVYAADDTVMIVPVRRPSLANAGACCFAIPAHGIIASLPGVEPRPRHVRPPGDGAATLQTFLPHVLRV